MFEIWKAINGRKSYIVAKTPNVDALSIFSLSAFSKRYFKVSAKKITIQQAWIYNDELYLEDPHKSKAKKRLVAYLKRKGE